MEMRAAGGTSVPLMLDWLMWLSMPKVNAEWEKPENKTPFTFIKKKRKRRRGLSAEHKMCTNIQREVGFDPDKAARDRIQRRKKNDGITSMTFESIMRHANVNVDLSGLLVAWILPGGHERQSQ